jgi:futalosine hydrolase
MPVLIGAFAKYCFVLFFAPGRVIQLMGGIKMFNSGEVHHIHKIGRKGNIWWGFQDICSMHIVLIAATTFEIQPVIDFLQQPEGSIQGHSVEVVITGVGLLHTSYRLTSCLRQHRPDLMLQAGIGGSFSSSLSPGQVVLVGQEIVGDLGVEEDRVFKDVTDMGFLPANEFPYANKWLVNAQVAQWAHPGLPVVKGITVNEITTRPERIALLQQKYAASVESMEGAAFHYVALQEGIPFLQLRAISNFVGERDKAKWRIKEAITGLNDELMKILAGISF